MSVSGDDDDDDDDSEPVAKRRRSGRTMTIKGHPWSDESDNEDSSRAKLRSQLSAEPSESDSTRRSTRMYVL